MAINRGYIHCSGPCMPRGILKIVIMVLSLGALISAVVPIGWLIRKGWLGFVAGIVLFTELIWFVLYLCRVNEKFPAKMYIVELITQILYIVLVLIAVIVAATTGAVAFIAYCVFGFPLLGLLIWDLILFVSHWRVVRSSHTTTTTTTTTHQADKNARY